MEGNASDIRHIRFHGIMCGWRNAIRLHLLSGIKYKKRGQLSPLMCYLSSVCCVPPTITDVGCNSLPVSVKLEISLTKSSVILSVRLP